MKYETNNNTHNENNDSEFTNDDKEELMLKVYKSQKEIERLTNQMEMFNK